MMETLNVYAKLGKSNAMTSVKIGTDQKNILATITKKGLSKLDPFQVKDALNKLILK